MLNSPLRRLRFIGFWEGISYLVLLLVAMPLKYWAGWPEAVRVVGSVHGGLFILFVLSVAEVTIRRPWWSPLFWGAAALAALLPCGTFVFDGWLARVETTEEKRAEEPAS